MLVFTALCATALTASASRLIPNSRMVRVEGYWGPAEEGAKSEAVSESKPIGHLNLAISADGVTIRRFAVTTVRTYQLSSGGMEVFTKSSIAPVVNMRGRTEVLAEITAMADGERLTFYAQFAAGSSELLITGIVREEEEASD
jgi:hypothetical protein